MSEPESTAAPVIAPQKSPSPLGIRHLLLWMTCSAVLLTTDQTITSVLATVLTFEPKSRVYWNLYQAYSAIVEGPAVIALGIWLLRGRKEWNFPVQPGEWLLLSLGSITSLDLLDNLFVTYSYTHNPSDLTFYNYLYSLKLLLIVSCLSLIALRNPFPNWWRLAILCYAGLWVRWFKDHISEMFPAIWNYFPWVPDLKFTYSTIPFIALLVCLGIDRYKHVKHTWLHYAGAMLATLDLLGIIVFANCKSFFS